MVLKKFIQYAAHHVERVVDKMHQQWLPSRCTFCGFQTGLKQNLCPDCFKNLPILTHSCPRCARFLHSGPLLCGICLQKPPPFDLTYALFPYQRPIIQLIIALKFQSQLSHAKTLGELLTQKISCEWYQHQLLPDVIIPVPLHPKRLVERGFNQALEIAKPVAKNLHLPMDILTVKRCKYTHAQSGLSAKERQDNMHDAFVCYKDYTNLTIAVIDDVITTGHTMTAFCEVLKQKHAKSIHVWCCARRDIALKPKKL